MKNKFKLITSFLIVLFYMSCQSSTYKKGKMVYEDYCANCHMENGTGLEGIIPPLVSSDYLKNSRENLACIIRYGQSGEVIVNGKSYNQVMTAIPELSEVDIANVLNYIFTTWGNNEPFISDEEVKNHLQNCTQEEIE